MTPLKKQKRKTRMGRWRFLRMQAAKKRVDKRTTVDEIAVKARELGYKFKSSPPLVGKEKP